MEPQNESATQEHKEPQDVLFNLLRDGSPIPDKELIKMVIRFKNNHPDTYGRTKGIWFSLADLRNIHDLILSSVPVGKEPYGVRVYFGRYHSADISERRNRPTVVLVPTYEERNAQGNLYHEDAVDDRDIAEAKYEVSHGDPFNEKMFDGYNHGQLCPPNCGKIGSNI